MSNSWRMYNVSAEIEFLLDSVDEETGELEEGVAERLLELMREKEELIEDVALEYKNLSLLAESVKMEKNRLAEKQKRLESQAESKKALLAEVLSGRKFKTEPVSVYQTHSKAVEFTGDASKLPENLRRVTYMPDKKAIADALKSGEQIEGAVQVERTGLVVR